MKYYFVGIAGTGMSALAQISRLEGNIVCGSDRTFDTGKGKEIKEKFEKLGIKIYPQNGKFIDRSFDLVIISTAVEEDNPDILKAKELGVKIVHRSDFLSEYVNKHKTIAVGGTSGKSTVTAMIYDILEKNNLSPSIITGGALNSLIKKGFIGNAFKGKSKWLVIEADESDGTISKYFPFAGIVLNISKDHKDIPELRNIFSNFVKNCENVFLNGDDENLKNISDKARYFSSSEIEDLKLFSFYSEFKYNGVFFKLPLPGFHNVINALCAIKICNILAEISLEKISQALLSYEGVYRRFNIIGEKKGIIVIDDYAHNPAKISATLKTAHIDKEKRIIAIYQPHGFAPTRLLKQELISTFEKELNDKDILFMPEIYYAGGTVNKDISSLDLVNALKEKGKNAFYFEKREDIISEIKKIVKEDDIILVMGARDITLNDFAKKIYSEL